jgi:hypothetical protein
MVTPERLRELLQYNPDTGIFTWIKPSSNRIKVGSVASCKDAYGYIVIRIDSKLYKAHRLAWLYCFNEFPEMSLDHVNGKKDDNRLDNLRECSSQDNNRNKSRQSNNSSGHVGVSYYAPYSKYRAGITINKSTLHIGYFDTVEEASLAYQNKAKDLFGEFKRESTNNVPR